MSDEDDLYGEEPAQNVGNGPTTVPKSTKMDNLAATMHGPKTGKVMLITGGVVLATAGILLVVATRHKAPAPLPAAVSGVDVGGTPQLRDGGSTALTTSPQYQQMTESVNKERVTDAQKTGASVMPLAQSTEMALKDFKTPSEQAKDSSDEAIAKQNALLAAQARAITGGPQVAGQPAQAQPVQVAMAQPSQAYTDMMKNASESMRTLITPHLHGMQAFERTSAVQVAAATPPVGTAAAAAAAAAADAKNANTKTLIGAGEVDSIRIDSGINTDRPSDFVATILTGKYAGAKLMGSYKLADDVAAGAFRSMTIPAYGITVPVTAVMLDAKSLEPGTADDVDHKLLVKYGVKPLAAALSAIGQAFATAGTATVINGTAVSTTTPIVTPALERGVALGAAAKQLDSDTSALNTTPTARVFPGSIVGVLFTADVVYTPK
jgi:hypothetical protein